VPSVCLIQPVEDFQNFGRALIQYQDHVRTNKDSTICTAVTPDIVDAPGSRMGVLELLDETDHSGRVHRAKVIAERMVVQTFWIQQAKGIAQWQVIDSLRDVKQIFNDRPHIYPSLTQKPMTACMQSSS
jgi:hypothetical protein